MAPRRRALLVDACTPTPARDARSLRIFRLMQLLRERGFDVTFVPANLDAPLPERQLLRSHGLRVIASPETRAVVDFAEREDERFDLCWICRPRVANELLARLRSAQPGARFVFDAADLVTSAALPGARDALPATDATVIDVEPASARAGTLEGLSGVHILPKIQAPPPRPIAVDCRTDGFFAAGFQTAPALDGLLWFLEDVLPTVLEAEPRFRLYVPSHDWSRVLSRSHARHRHVVLVDATELQSPRFLDRFRVVVAPFRLSPGVPGLLQMALARGVPCVSTPDGSAGLAESARGPLLGIDSAPAFAGAISALLGDADAWNAASDVALESIRRGFCYEDARATLARICAALGLDGDDRRDDRRGDGALG